MKLLFIAGSGSGKEAWVYQTEYFADAEAIALPGHPEGKPCPSVDEYVAGLRAYIHQQQYQDVVLVGHSLGGAIAQLYGLKYGDEVKTLVLIGTGARLKVSPDFLASVKQMIIDESAWRRYVEDSYSAADPRVRQCSSTIYFAVISLTLWTEFILSNCQPWLSVAVRTR